MTFQTFAHFSYFYQKMPHSNPTIKDIARELKISPSTVSRALKDHPRIGLRTREKVKELALEWNYEPNQLAVSLQNKRTNTIGIILPELAFHFFSKILSGIEQKALKEGYNILITQSGENFEREMEAIGILTRAKVDGFIVSSSKETKSFAHFNNLIKKGFPVVFFDRVAEKFPFVVSNDEKGAEMLVNHFIKRGCKRIAHIAGPKNISNARERLFGYAEALRNNQLKVDQNLIVYTNLDKESNIEATATLLNLPQLPDAIFCYNDYVAYDAATYLQRKGLKIGVDILLGGFANEPVSGYMSPSLTTVEQNALIIGEKTVELLIKMINGESVVGVTVDTQILVRESSGTL